MENCYSCGAKLTVVKDKPYKYDESGLDVVLHGITQYECESCGESYAALPSVQNLHRAIGLHICEKRKALLRAEEIRFLRKDLHQKAKEFAQYVGVDPSTVSRWEKGKQEISEAHDRFIRSLYMMFASEQATYTLCTAGVGMFRELPARRHEIKEKREIVLNPAEWINEVCVA